MLLPIMENRPYQIKAINAVWNAFRTDTRVLLVAATGAGKDGDCLPYRGAFLSIIRIIES